MATIGPYAVVREIGRGGMGVVLEARGPDGARVAVKLLLDPGAATALERFERERRLLAELGEDAGFVPLLDSGSAREGPYVVMPFVGGGTLRARMPLDLAQTFELGEALATALGRAHERGIVHRDLKPENILFTDDGRPLVSDLGLAKHFVADAPGAARSVALTRTGELRGTLGYMPKEQLEDASRAGPQADVFAIGAILYECLAGRRPFEGENAYEVTGRVITGTFTPLAVHAPETPRALAAAIERALARDPAQRFANGADLAAAIARAASGARGGSRAWILCVAAIPVVAIGAFVALRSTQPPKAEAPVIATAPPSKETPPPAPVDPLSRATALLEKNELDAAARAFDDLAGKSPRALAIGGRGIARARAGDVAAGNADLAHALALLREPASAPDGPALARWLEEDDRAGRAWASVALGRMLSGALGVPRDDTRAQRFYRRAADAGDPEAMVLLSGLIRSARGSARDRAAANELCRRAAALGSARAMAHLAISLSFGVAREREESEKWARQAADKGDALGRYQLAKILAGPNRDPDETREADRLYKLALVGLRAEEPDGDPEVLVTLGRMLDEGLGTMPDPEAALKVREKVVETGDVRAMADLGRQLFNGRGAPRDTQRGLAWIRRSADGGHPVAILEVGEILERGLGGIAQDEAQAAEWYRKGVDKGNVESGLRLVKMYDEGRGVAKDPRAATQLLEKLANLGSPKAQNDLGVRLSLGKGAPRDDATAVALFRKAAAAGVASAFVNLGTMVEQGRGGLARDREQALKLFRRAAELGDPEGKAALERLSR